MTRVEPGVSLASTSKSWSFRPMTPPSEEEEYDEDVDSQVQVHGGAAAEGCCGFSFHVDSCR